jgi:hypothetical protein
LFCQILKITTSFTKLLEMLLGKECLLLIWSLRGKASEVTVYLKLKCGR